jgi:hypothetical protein
MRFIPQKFTSGGQTGADRAGLDGAIALGIPHGGWCPAGRKSEDGAIPEQYCLKETASDRYDQRTMMNVIEGDGTVVFNRGGRLSAGSRLTVRLCQDANRPCLVLDCSNFEQDVEKFKNWLEQVKPTVLNIAGNRESVSPGIGDYVRQVLWETFSPKN